MKHIILAALLVSFAAPVLANDWCIGVQKHTFSSSYPPSGVRTQYGFVHKDSPTCAPIWTSDSVYNPPAVALSGAEYLQAGCSVYNQDGPNLTNDLAFCYIMHPAQQDCSKDPLTGIVHCNKLWYFWKAQTPDNGDGL